MPLYSATFTYADADGHQKSFQVHLVEATPADAETEFRSLAGNIDALTSVGLVSINMNIPVDIGGLAVQKVPDANSNVEIGGRFTFNVEGGFSTYFTVPGFRIQDFTVNGGLIDTNNATVAAFVTKIVDGDYKDRRQADISSLKSAYEVFNGTR